MSTITDSSATGWCTCFDSKGTAYPTATRWVRTPKWQLEHSSGRALFGSWGDPRTADPLALDQDDGVANTSILWLVFFGYSIAGPFTPDMGYGVVRVAC
jgi:hypothetical protein